MHIIKAQFTPIYKNGGRFFSALAKRSMFKCLTSLALNKSGSNAILILRYWSSARFGLLPFQNQIKSIGIILNVIYLMSTALGQRDFEGSFTGSKICLIDSRLYFKVKSTIL